MKQLHNDLFECIKDILLERKMNVFDVKDVIIYPGKEQTMFGYFSRTPAYQHFKGLKNVYFKQFETSEFDTKAQGKVALLCAGVFEEAEQDGVDFGVVLQFGEFQNDDREHLCIYLYGQNTGEKAKNGHTIFNVLAFDLNGKPLKTLEDEYDDPAVFCSITKRRVAQLVEKLG